MNSQAPLKAARKSTTNIESLAGVPRLITGMQIRAGRALLRWSADELAQKCGLSYATIQRAEQVEGMPRMTAVNLVRIKSELERAGIEFDADGRGARLGDKPRGRR